MKQLIKINNSELGFRLKLNYNNVYARLKMLLGKDASFFADISPKSTSTTWYADDNAEYLPLSEASEAEKSLILSQLNQTINRVSKELKTSPELSPYADEIIEVPEYSFIFYRKIEDTYKIILTAWGCKYAHTGPTDPSNNVIKKITKQYEFETPSGKIPEIEDDKGPKDVVIPPFVHESNDLPPHSHEFKKEVSPTTDIPYSSFKQEEISIQKEINKHEEPDNVPPKKLQRVLLRVLDQNNNPVSGESVSIRTNDSSMVKESNGDGFVDIGHLSCFSQFTISFPHIGSVKERTYEVEPKVEVYDAYIKKLVKYSPIIFVEDQNGHSVQDYDVKIIVAGQDSVYNTGDDGIIQLPPMIEGQRIIVIDTKNYANTVEFDITSAQAKVPYHFKVKRSERAKIGITLLDKSGKPISNALVNLELGDTPCHQMTGEDGRAEFPYDVFTEGIIPIAIKTKNKSTIKHELNFNPEVTEYTVQIKNKNALSGMNWKWLGILPLLALLGWGGSELYNRFIDKTPSLDEMKSGVLLLLNETTYYVDFDIKDITIDGNPCVAYFRYSANERKIDNVTFNPRNKVPSVGTGTGFLISEDGLIATNKHVADPMIPQKLAEKMLREHFQGLKEYNQNRCNNINDSLNLFGLSGLGVQKYRLLYTELKYRQQQAQIWERILNVGNFEVKKKTNLYAAFTGTNIDPELDTFDGFIGCNHLISGKNGDNLDENDVAIIQLRNKEKEIPKEAFIFKVPKEDVLGKKMPKDRRITVIGYNAGFGLQNLKKQDGIQPQIQSGEINNLAEKYRIGYDAGILGGSSGSPVVNDDGLLVAVNNSGIGGSDSFNYGIRTKYLREILDELLSTDDENNKSKNKDKIEK